MIQIRIILIGIIFTATAVFSVRSQQLPRDQWGAMPVTVSHAAGRWIIKGNKNTVTISESDLALTIQAGSTQWNLAPSKLGDMVVKSQGRGFFPLRIADAKKFSITPYLISGFKSGVKISIAGWQQTGRAIDLGLFITICLEGKSEGVGLRCRCQRTQHDSSTTRLAWRSRCARRGLHASE